MCYKIEKILDFFRYDVPHGIKNLISWFPIIWNHRNWDAEYSLIMLRESLIRLNEVVKEDTWHLDAKKNEKEITICIECLKRLTGYNNFSYQDMVFKYHDKKWGEMSCIFKECENDLYEMIFNREHIHTEADKERESKEYRRLLADRDRLQQQDIDIMLSKLKKYRKWWV